MLETGAVIICEDIRHEVGEKYSLMGVYGEILSIPDGGGRIPLFIYLEVKNVPSGIYTLRLKLDVPGNKSRNIKIEIEGESVAGATIVSPRMSYNIDSPGYITLSMIDDDHIIELTSKKILFSDASDIKIED